jgi:hypothetical protein
VVSRKQEKPQRWTILRIRKSPAEDLGTVNAPDAETAIERALEQFELKPDQRPRLRQATTRPRFANGGGLVPMGPQMGQ